MEGDTMFLTKLKIATAALAAVAVLGTGMGIVSHRALAGQRDGARPADQKQDRERRENAAADRERGREARKAPAFQGKITAIGDDGKSLTLETRAGRGEEPKTMVVKLTDKSKVEFAQPLKDLGKKMKVGDIAAVWLQEGSTDVVATLEVHRPPDHAGKITAVSADQKSLTLEVPPKERGAAPEKVEIKLTDKTRKGVGRGEAVKMQVGHLATVWLEEGSKDAAAVLQVSRPRADASGVVTAISADGKVLSLESKGRSGEVTKSQVKLADATKIEFVGGEAKKLKVGQSVMVWFQEGSTDTAATVLAHLQPAARSR
jgi:hypothetical protein